MDAEVEQCRAAVREAAQLRYELARLRDRRTVRAALAVSGVLGARGAGSGGGRGSGAHDGRRLLGGALSLLRGELPRIDMPGPVHAPARTPYPQLRIAVIGVGAPVAGAAARQPLTTADAQPLIARDRPDLLLVDDPQGWQDGQLRAAIRAVRAHGGAVVTTPPASVAVPDADLVLDLPAAVDIGRWSPVGLDDTGEPVVRHDPEQLTPADAQQQPVVIVTDPDRVGHDRCLALLSAGALVVAPGTPALRRALAGLAEADQDALLAPADAGATPGATPATVSGTAPGTAPGGAPWAGRVGGPVGVLPAAPALAERVEALLADADRRRRLSVRVRRYVQRERSTDAAVTAMVTALGSFPAPDASITALLATRRPDRLAQVLADLDAQRHPDIEVVVLLHGDAPVPDRLLDRPRVRVVERLPAEVPLGAVLDRGLVHASGTAVAKVDDDDRYGPDHLGDLLLSLRVSGADIVGRRVHGVFVEDGAVTLHPPPGGEERYEDHLPGATMLVRGEVLRTLRWRHVRSGVDSELVRAVHLGGGSAYTAHRYGFVRGRHGDHTYEASSWTGRAVPGFDAQLLEA